VSEGAAARAAPGHSLVLRTGASGAGGPLQGLAPNESVFFSAGEEAFVGAEGIGDGLGPRFNLDSCGGCHSQPGVGGSSPAVNPQVAVASEFGARNTVPAFITSNGPIREARFKTQPGGARSREGRVGHQRARQ
jgi:hypothetical protein